MHPPVGAPAHHHLSVVGVKIAIIIGRASRRKKPTSSPVLQASGPSVSEHAPSASTNHLIWLHIASLRQHLTARSYPIGVGMPRPLCEIAPSQWHAPGRRTTPVRTNLAIAASDSSVQTPDSRDSQPLTLPRNGFFGCFALTLEYHVGKRVYEATSPCLLWPPQPHTPLR
jgi:hypothetical protein